MKDRLYALIGRIHSRRLRHLALDAACFVGIHNPVEWSAHRGHGSHFVTIHCGWCHDHLGYRIEC